jgi:hypothetical protein
MTLAEKTRELRYRLIYILSPSAYHTISVSDVPRPMIKFVKKVHGDTSLVGAEIGTGAGNNARSILEILNIKRSGRMQNTCQTQSIRNFSNPSQLISTMEESRY